MGATTVDICVIGGGQAGLAVGYYLQRSAAIPARGTERRPASFVILDDRGLPGGAWLDAWTSLELFSPAAYSSLPGWQMPAWSGAGNPSANHVREYLAEYEKRYALPIHRPVAVHDVADTDDARDLSSDRAPLVVRTDKRDYTAQLVINATGTWRQPHWPAYPGMTEFEGTHLHTADYRDAQKFHGQRVVVVGGGNSGAQIAADLLGVAAELTWVTARPPRYLPDDVDGRILFERASQAILRGSAPGDVGSLGDIVVVASVRRARDLHGLRAEPMFERVTSTGVAWDGGRHRDVDTIVWCTGFRPALRHLRSRAIVRRSGVPVTDARAPTRSIDDPRVRFVGYGDWSGPAAATLVGSGRVARSAVHGALEYLRGC